MATPMGRYQVVGATLRVAQEEMGLPDDTVFDQKTQDAIFEHLARKRLMRATDAQGRVDRAKAVKEFRNEWDGFKNVPESVLWDAIKQYARG